MSVSLGVKVTAYVRAASATIGIAAEPSDGTTGWSKRTESVPPSVREVTTSSPAALGSAGETVTVRVPLSR